MEEARAKIKIWLAIFIAVAVLLIVGPLIARKLIRKMESSILEAKMAHGATAIVIRKEHIRYDDKNHTSFNDDGESIDRPIGFEEWRVYYQINRFDRVEKTTELEMLKAEEKRTAKEKPRFTLVSKEQYDAIRDGDKLVVTWRQLGMSKIEIISAGKAEVNYVR